MIILMRKLFLVLLLFPLISQAALPFKNYQQWTNKDRLHYSTFNEGEKWRWKRAWNKPKVENLSLPERIALCAKYKGAWNYYIDDCSFQNDAYILEYINERERSKGFHLSAPAREVQPEEVKVEQVDFKKYKDLSPQWQLHFSTFGDRLKTKKKIVKRSAPKRFKFVGKSQYKKWNKHINYRHRRR